MTSLQIFNRKNRFDKNEEEDEIKFFNILILLYSGMVNRAGIAGDIF